MNTVVSRERLSSASISFSDMLLRGGLSSFQNIQDTFGRNRL